MKRRGVIRMEFEGMGLFNRGQHITEMVEVEEIETIGSLSKVKVLDSQIAHSWKENAWLDTASIMWKHIPSPTPNELVYAEFKPKWYWSRRRKELERIAFEYNNQNQTAMNAQLAAILKAKS